MSHANVLYIEDNPADAELFSNLINHASSGKMHVVSAQHLSDACKMLDAHPYNAVLVDLNLKEVSGTHPVALLKQHYPDLPIIVLTGQDDDLLASKTVQLGAQDFIVKGAGDGHALSRSIHHSILRQQHNNQLFFSTNYDESTTLPKYQLFMEHLRHAIARARRKREEAAVILLDIDGFYSFGLENGFEISERVMQELAIRLSSTIRQSDIAARYGADKMVLLIESLENGTQECLQIAGKIMRALETPFQAGGQQLSTITLCTGIAIFPHAGNDEQEIIGAARKALTHAKKRGAGKVEIYTSGT